MSDWRRPPPSTGDFQFPADKSFELNKADDQFVSWASSHLDNSPQANSSTSDGDVTGNASTSFSRPAPPTIRRPSMAVNPPNTSAEPNGSDSSHSYLGGRQRPPPPSSTTSAGAAGTSSMSNTDRTTPPSSAGGAGFQRRLPLSARIAEEDEKSSTLPDSPVVVDVKPAPPSQSTATSKDQSPSDVEDVVEEQLPMENEISSTTGMNAKPTMPPSNVNKVTSKADAQNLWAVGCDHPTLLADTRGLTDGRCQEGNGKEHADDDDGSHDVEKNISWSDWLYDFSQDTTIHGLGYITRKTRFVMRRIFWFILWGVALGLTTYFCYSRIAFYLTFQLSVSVEVDFLNKVQFPAVTFCNQNSFKLTSVADNGWYDIVESLYANTASTTRKCKNGTEFQCVTSKQCIFSSMRCDLFPDCSDGSDETRCSPCQLYQMTLSPGGDVNTTVLPPSVRQYIGQYYELQNATFNSSSPIYVRRPPSNVVTGKSEPSVWLYYNPTTDRWELADSYLNQKTVLFGYSLSAGPGQSDQPQPSTGPEALYGLRWTFVNGNTTVNNVTFSCTFDFKNLLNASAPNLTLARQLSLATLHNVSSQLQSDFITSCYWKGDACDAGSIKPRFTDMGLCYTFNSSDMYVENSGPGSGLSFTANIELYQYTKSASSGIGIKLLMHDSEDVPAVSLKGTSISPGLHSYISLETTEVTNMPPPWGTCGSTSLNYYSFYSVATCVAECETDHVYQHCGCIDVNMPNDNGRMPVCTVESYVDCLGPVLSEMRAAGNYCTCPTPCSGTNYVPTASFAVVMGPDSTAGSVLDDTQTKLLNDLLDATETAYRVSDSMASSTLRSFHVAEQALARASRFASGSGATINAGHDVIVEHAVEVTADCISMRNTLMSARQAIVTNVVEPIENFRAQFLPSTLRTFYQIQDSASDAIGRVNWCYWWGCTASQWDSVLLRVSQDNCTIWTAYRTLTLTLNRLSSTFVPSLQNSINSLPSLNQFRIDQSRVNLLLPLIGVRCTWCISASGSSVLSLVKTKISSTIGTGSQLNNYISTANSYLNSAFNSYLMDTYIANLSSTVTGGNIYQYNSWMWSVSTNLANVGPMIDNALVQAKDAVGMIDDLLDFIWTQKCQIELPKLLTELNSNQLVTSALLNDVTTFLDTQRQSIDVYCAQYSAGNLTLQSVANSIKYDVITSTVSSKKVRLDTNLVDRIQQIGLVQQSINGIYYLLLTILDDNFVLSNSQYWTRFGVTSVVLEQPTTARVANITVPIDDYGITIPDVVATHWSSLTDDIQTAENNLQLQSDTLNWAIGYIKSYMTNYLGSIELTSTFYTNNFLQVDLFYKELTQSSVTQQAAYTSENLLGELGGYLGLLLGASVLSLFELFDTFFYFLLAKHCPRRRRHVSPTVKQAWETS